MLEKIHKLAEGTSIVLKQILEEENILMNDDMEIFSLRRIATELYNSFFMKVLPIDIWKSFFTDYERMVQEFLMNPFLKKETFSDSLNIIFCSMFQKEHDKFIRYFTLSYGFFPILRILESSETTDFVKQRELQQVCEVVGDDARVYRCLLYTSPSPRD